MYYVLMHYVLIYYSADICAHSSMANKSTPLNNCYGHYLGQSMCISRFGTEPVFDDNKPLLFSMSLCPASFYHEICGVPPVSRQEELVSLISGARAWGGATSGPPPQQTDFKLHTPAVYPLELPGPLFIVQYSVRRSVVYAVQYSAQFSVQYSMAEWGVQVFSGL